MHEASCGDDVSRRRCWVWMSSAAERARCLCALAAAGPAPAAVRAAAAIATAVVLVMRFMGLLVGRTMPGEPSSRPLTAALPTPYGLRYGPSGGVGVRNARPA